jgi:hypothetical protein
MHIRCQFPDKPGSGNSVTCSPQLAACHACCIKSVTAGCAACGTAATMEVTTRLSRQAARKSLSRSLPGGSDRETENSMAGPLHHDAAPQHAFASSGYARPSTQMRSAIAHDTLSGGAQLPWGLCRTTPRCGSYPHTASPRKTMSAVTTTPHASQSICPYIA